jgi:hypothetical protein
MKKTILLALLVIGSVGCFKNYFKVKTTPGWNYEQLKKYERTKMTFVVHYNDEALEMVDPVVSEKEIRGTVGKYTYRNKRYQDPDPFDQTHVYKMKDKQQLFSEVHIFVKGNYNNDPNVVIDSSNFLDSRTYEPNKGASVGSHVLGVGMIIVGMAAIAVGAAAIACNCPQVYVEAAPAQYEFVAGMYSGAIMRTLERTDYLPLPGLLNARDTVRLKISGMPGETQYLNYVNIKEVTHPKGTELVTNQHGSLFLLNKLNTPEQVSFGSTLDKSKYVWYRDGKSYDFFLPDSNANASILDLTFTNKKKAHKALLVARMKNTDWGGYVYHQFINLYGSAYPQWVAQQEKNNNNASDWQKAQGLMMKVQVLTKNGWKIVDYFSAAGNTSTRDLAMEIPLNEIEGNIVRIRMESAYRFWEVDEVGLTYTFSRAEKVKELKPIAILKNEQDQFNTLSISDQQYLVLDDKEELKIEFVGSKSNAETIRTYVLVAGGYYHQKPGNDAPPQTALLKTFLNPGAFHHYSLNKFNQLAIRP